MASGKLTPRQKMINMMYLVLMALLALNVSKEILDAFEIIKGGLSRSAALAAENSQNIMSAMKEKVAEEKIDRNMGIPDTLNLINSKTAEIIGLINEYQAKMDEFADKDPATGELKRKDEMEANFQFWMGQGQAATANDGRGSGAAKELKDKINEYFAFLADMKRANYLRPEDKAKVEAQTLPDEVEGQDGMSKSWELYHFDGPVVANMAILEHLKQDLYSEQKEALDVINERLGTVTFKIDKIIPINSPVSTIVPSGLQFETRLSVGISSSSIVAQYSSPNGSVQPQDDGTAILTIPASASAIPQGKNEGKQSYTATINVPKSTGGTESLSVTGEFTVRKPEVKITSATVQNLYRECANDVEIDVPALGNFYNPSVKVSSGSIQSSPRSKTTFRIIPTGSKCVVSVSNVLNGKTSLIDNVAYNVISPPRPALNMRVNGQNTNGSVPIPKNSRIDVVVVPDPEFKAALPNDARYEISSIAVKAGLSLGPPTTVNNLNLSGQDATKPIPIRLGAQVAQAPSNTKVYIEIEDIYRKNFQNKLIRERLFSLSDKTLSIVVR